MVQDNSKHIVWGSRRNLLTHSGPQVVRINFDQKLDILHVCCYFEPCNIYQTKLALNGKLTSHKLSLSDLWSHVGWISGINCFFGLAKTTLFFSKFTAQYVVCIIIQVYCNQSVQCFSLSLYKHAFAQKGYLKPLPVPCSVQ